MLSSSKIVLATIVIAAAACSVWVFNDGGDAPRKMQSVPNEMAVVNSDTQSLGETTPATAVDTTLPLWSPGGVLGPSLEDTVSELDSIFKSIFHADINGNRYEEDIQTALCRSAEEAKAVAGGGKLQTPLLLDMIRNVTEALMAHSLRRDDDCVQHLVPHHRAICLVAAALDKGHDESCSLSRISPGGQFIPMSQRCAFRETFCSRLLPCVQWTRGRFRVNLSGELLQEVMTQRVMPKIRRNRELFHLHQNVFLHGEVSDAMMMTAPPQHPSSSSRERKYAVNLKELRWLKRRHRNQEVVMDEIRAVFRKQEEEMTQAMGYTMEPMMSKKKKTTSYSAGRRGIVSLDQERASSAPTLSLSTTDVFQGLHVIATAPTAESKTPFTTLTLTKSASFSSRAAVTANRSSDAPSSDIVSPHRSKGRKTSIETFEYLSSVETLAVLYSLCLRNSSTDTQGMPCVLLMHGDSVLREFYDRLIIHIRYGFREHESVSEEWKYKALQFQVSSTEDFVYRVFATHDEVFRLSDTFANDATDATLPSYSLRRYMNAMTTAFRKRHLTDTIPPESHAFPLFHIIFVWDNKSDKPRSGLYTPKVLEPAHVPLQIHGLNFWGRAINYKMLSSLWEMTRTTITDESSTARGGFIRDRLLYIMTPPHVQPAGASFTPSDVDGVISRNFTQSEEGDEEDLERNSPLIPDPCLTNVEANWGRSQRVIARWRQEGRSRMPQSYWSIKRCAHHSITRSLQWLLWLNDTVAERQLVRTRRHAEETSQRFAINSVAVFDKGKGQFAGFTMSDRLHYGCRCQAIRSRSRYGNSLFPPTLERLLSRSRKRQPAVSTETMSSTLNNMRNTFSSPYCEGTVSAKALSALLHSMLSSSTQEFWETLEAHIKNVDSAKQSTAAPLHNFGKRLDLQAGDGPEQKFFTLVERNGLPPEEDTHLFAVMPSNPPKSFVYLDWMSGDCRGSGDLYFLQLLLYDAALKKLHVPNT